MEEASHQSPSNAENVDSLAPSDILGRTTGMGGYECNLDFSVCWRCSVEEKLCMFYESLLNLESDDHVCVFFQLLWGPIQSSGFGAL